LRFPNSDPAFRQHVQDLKRKEDEKTRKKLNKRGKRENRVIWKERKSSWNPNCSKENAKLDSVGGRNVGEWPMDPRSAGQL
jgi:hypothetical protein